MSPITDSPAPPMKKRPAPPSPPMDPLGVDYGDGELIPPLPDNPYPAPGANAGGGPGAPLPESGPGIFEGLYTSGLPGGLPQFGRPALGETSSPPPMMPPPLNAPVEPPRHLQAQPMGPMGPMAGPGPGPNAPMRRFPRATSLIPSGPPMRQGY